ncbi:MAG TPA: 50S ribosomal protein L2 [Candidatus Saccharimonadales bacterium]|nr:50S ribosomal protein L2 [Candidatus Saccharimonadales bacterium]
MSIKQYNPTTPGRRGMSSQDFSGVTTKKPVKSLLVTKRRGSGRNNQGKITTRHQGGGARKHYRLVNFNFKGEGVIEHIEYDPNRSARIARVKEANGTYHYVLAAKDMQIGQKLTAHEEAPIESGNRLPIRNIPVGATIHAIELKPGRGAQLVRSAGGGAQLMAKEGDYGQVRLPSGEIRLVHLTCTATIGVIGNEQHQNIKLGKAGRNRHKGIRPSVHGKAMNPVDHPMGGGEGQTGPGRIPRTPWGKVAIGLKTRRRKSTSNMIVRSRHAAKRK